jgi:hypothetical protein
MNANFQKWDNGANGFICWLKFKNPAMPAQCSPGKESPIGPVGRRYDLNHISLYPASSRKPTNGVIVLLPWLGESFKPCAALFIH